MALFALSWSAVGSASPVHGQAPAPQSAPPVWQPLDGPAGSIGLLAVESGTKNLYAVADINSRRREDQTQWSSAGAVVRSAALYRSQDGGATWQPATNGLDPGPITSLFADSNTGAVFLSLEVERAPGTGGPEGSPGQQSDLLISADHGARWRPVPLDLPDLDIQRITQSADGGHLLLGATAGGGSGQQPASYVLSSSDGGATWQAAQMTVSDKRSDSALVDLIPDPKVASRLFVTTGGGEICETTDLGRTWKVVLGAGSASASATITQPGAEPSSDAAASEVASGPVHLAVAADHPDVLLAVRTEPVSRGAGRGNRLTVQRSTDGGTSWSMLPPSGLPQEATPNTLAALGGGSYLLNTSLGTYRSTDRGATWQLLEGPLSSGDVSTFLTIPGPSTSVLAATAYGLFISRDAGAIWQPLGKGLPFNSHIAGLLTDARQPNRVFAITYAASPDQSPANGGASDSTPALRPPMLLRSADGGTTWTPASSGLPGVLPMAWEIDPNDPNTLVISSRELVFRTEDAGLNWHASGLPAGGHFALAIAPSDSTVIYVGGNPPHRSMDRGATWQKLSPVVAGESGEVTGMVVDPADAAHVWAAVSSKGVYETQDGGTSWQATGPGMEGKPIRWLSRTSSPPSLYAGATEGGIYRWDPQGRFWMSASGGLPAQSTILSFAEDPRLTSTLWASRDGGGIYRSTDGGTSWSNVSSMAVPGGTSLGKTRAGIGDNLVQALANDFTAEGSMFLGMATAGLWTLRADAGSAPGPNAVDARIEVVWPHDSAPVTDAKLANIGLRLFAPGSLAQPPCSWSPRVTVWQAEDNNPAKPLEEASQRTIDGQPFPFWELNDVDVSYATDPQHKLYFMVQVSGADTATSIWTHGADPRTRNPFPEVPSGIATGKIEAVDARIQVVWPHGADGSFRDTTDADYVNVSVALYKHGTRLSVPVDWTPAGIVLEGAWNQEIGQPLAKEAVVQERKAGAITYPTWEFNNIPVEPAKDPANKVHLWVRVDGVDTYPTIWTHGSDARTLFPAKDEPVQGCIP
jgi:photosystem II stability/assembly factor-like uncharacterized protein